MAEARTTLFNSVFMSATVWRTVASKVASSIASTPAFACPRATRPMRPKISERNAISSLLFFPYVLSRQAAQHAARRHHVHQKEMHAGQDVVLIFGTEVLQFAEIVQGDGDVTVPRVVKLERRGADAVIGGEHRR